jgi:hypothetical protein
MLEETAPAWTRVAPHQYYGVPVTPADSLEEGLSTFGDLTGSRMEKG